LSFDITKLPTGGVVVQVQFSEDAMAKAFKREFAR
jgi:hypothetical protein